MMRGARICALLLCIALAAGPAVAENCGARGQFPCGVVPPPTPQTHGQPLKNGDFQSRRGMVIRKQCFEGGWTNPGEAESTLDAMMDKAERCARTRMPLYTTSLFHGALSDKVVIGCDASDCSKGAGACAHVSRGEINFKESSSIRSPATWFHEYLHLADVDNENASVHNDPDIPFWDKVQRDEVYFWEAACFTPGDIVQAFRDGNYRLCRAAMTNYAARPNRVRHTQKAIDRTCGFFWDYWEEESRFITQVREGPYAEWFVCRASEDLDACPDMEAVREKLKAAGKEDLLPTPDTMVAWVEKRCALFDSRTVRTPWVAGSVCLMRSHVLPELERDLAGAGLSAAEKAGVMAYMGVMSKKSKLFLKGLDGIEQFPDSALDGGAKSAVDDTGAACRQDALLARTRFCKILLEETLPGMQRLLGAW